MRVRYLLQEAVTEHKATYSEDYTRDFIDVYLKEMKKRENTKETSTFSGESRSPVLSISINQSISISININI
jgi:hypothetical protein